MIAFTGAVLLAPLSANQAARLALYRSLRDTTVAKFGEAHFEAWDHTYRFFAGLFTAGRLGGARIVARKR